MSRFGPAVGDQFFRGTALVPGRRGRSDEYARHSDAKSPGHYAMKLAFVPNLASICRVVVRLGGQLQRAKPRPAPVPASVRYTGS